MPRAVVLSGVRTPVGRRDGALAHVRPDDLAAVAIGAAVERAGVPAGEIEDVWFGCANQAGEDNRNVARMAALLAGLPESVAGVTVNRLCASGLAAVAGVSERHLTRLLVEHAGQTPARLVRQVRLEAAATALVTTDQAVSAISKATGFRSGETLRQAFTAWFGISPTQYRTAHRRRGSA